MIKIGDTIVVDFILYDPVTALPIDADSTPVCAVYKSTEGTPLLSPTVQKRLVSAGAYMAEIDTTGMEEGVTYVVHVTATINGDSQRVLADIFSVSSKRISDITGIEGVNTVTITIEIVDTATPIEGVLVAVYNSGETLLLTSKRTDALGKAVFGLDDGTYKVRLKKSGYSFDTPETLVVSGDTADTFDGTLIDIGEPSVAGVCRVYDYAFKPDDSDPLATCSGTATIVKLPYDYSDKLYAGSTVDGTYDEETGLIYWDLVWGARVNFIIPALGVDVERIIPEETTIRLISL